MSTIIAEGNTDAYDHKQIGISKDMIDDMLEIQGQYFLFRTLIPLLECILLFIWPICS